MTFKISKYQLVLFLLVLFHGIVNWTMLKQDNVPFCYDESGIYEMSRIYYRHLVENFTWNPRVLFHHYWDTTHFYPPFYMLSHLPLFLLFGKSQDVSAMTNVVFLAILIFSVYGIGRKIKDEQAGFFAAVLVSTFPAIFGFSRIDFAVIALTSLVAFGIYLLLKTDNFTNRRYVILFGIAMGLGLLTKLTYPMYIVGPLFVYIAVNIKKMTRRHFGNLFLSLGIGLFIAFTWFAPNLITGSFFAEARRLMGFIWKRRYVRQIGQIDWSFYLRAFQIQLYRFFTWLSATSILIFIFLKIKKEFKYLLLSWLIIPLLFLLIYKWKEVRYTIPVLPVLALVISSAFYSIRPRRLRNLLYVCIIIFGLLQILQLSFSPDLKKQFTEKEYSKRREKGLISAYKVDWPVKEVINIFSDYKLIYKKNGKPARIIVIAWGPLISHLSYQIRLPAKLGRINAMPYDFIPYLLSPYSYFREEINNADYVLIEDKVRENFESDSFRYKYTANLLKEFEQNINSYIQLKPVILEEKTGKKLVPYINKNTQNMILSLKNISGEQE